MKNVPSMCEVVVEVVTSPLPMHKLRVSSSDVLASGVHSRNSLPSLDSGVRVETVVALVIVFGEVFWWTWFYIFFLVSVNQNAESFHTIAQKCVRHSLSHVVHDLLHNWQYVNSPPPRTVHSLVLHSNHCLATRAGKREDW